MTHRDFVPLAKSLTPSNELVHRAKVLITHPEVRRDPYTAMLAHNLVARQRWRKALALSSCLHDNHPQRSAAFALAIRVLLAMRGEKKLMKPLRRLRRRLSSWERTAIGNILLRHWVDRRDRRVRNDGNIAASLETLKTTLEFTPDRVTLNILVGRALRRSSCPTRALLDELVRHGYPAPHEPLFDIPLRGRPLQVFTMLDGMKSKKMSFTRHVRPLYKTFIRAMARKGDAEGMRIVVGALKYAQEHHTEQLRERGLRRIRRKFAMQSTSLEG